MVQGSTEEEKEEEKIWARPRMGSAARTHAFPLPLHGTHSRGRDAGENPSWARTFAGRGRARKPRLFLFFLFFSREKKKETVKHERRRRFSFVIQEDETQKNF